jgi:broad specificity phosphatase PhoE
MTFAHVLSRPLQRAQRTGELAGFGARAEAAADLIEWDYGAYEWETYRGHPGRAPRLAFIRGRLPRWGHSDRIVGRVRARAGDVLLFAHRDIFRGLAARWLGLGAREGRYLDEPVIHLWNDARH